MAENRDLGRAIYQIQQEAGDYLKRNGNLPLSYLKTRAKEICPGLELDGENWIKEEVGGKEVPYRPTSTAAIILSEKDNGEVSKVALADVEGAYPIVIADGKKAYIYDESGGLYAISGVNRKNLSLYNKIRTFIFGQKKEKEWVAANRLSEGLAKKGYRPTNDMSAYFILSEYLDSYRESGGFAVITPQRSVLVEPYDTKLRQRKDAYVIHSMNNGLPEGSRFVLVTVGGDPLYTEEGTHKKADTKDEVYDGSGWVAAPDRETYEKFMKDLSEIVSGKEFDAYIDSSGMAPGDGSYERIGRLRKEISRYLGKRNRAAQKKAA
ncbi:MAG: hypothetical protein JW727_01000 [Candidatus Aenigmarchaeota archaeon]|nr:hypothetical protein [Candidatus Aenigmarchaeota archaeon]